MNVNKKWKLSTIEIAVLDSEGLSWLILALQHTNPWECLFLFSHSNFYTTNQHWGFLIINARLTSNCPRCNLYLLRTYICMARTVLGLTICNESHTENQKAPLCTRITYTYHSIIVKKQTTNKSEHYDRSRGPWKVRTSSFTWDRMYSGDARVKVQVKNERLYCEARLMFPVHACMQPLPELTWHTGSCFWIAML